MPTGEDGSRWEVLLLELCLSGMGGGSGGGRGIVLGRGGRGGGTLKSKSSTGTEINAFGLHGGLRSNLRGVVVLRLHTAPSLTSSLLLLLQLHNTFLQKKYLVLYLIDVVN